MLYKKYSAEELQEQLDANKSLIAETVEASADITVRDLNDEEKQALRDGTLSPDEIVEMLTGDPQDGASIMDAAANADQNAPEDQPAPPEEQSEPPADKAEKPDEKTEYQKAVSEVVAKVYVLRERYAIELENLQEQAEAEYKTISAGSGKKELAAFAEKYISAAGSLEKQCDGEMDVCVAELQKIIGENGGEADIIDVVIETYVKEKSLKKAWYISQLEKKGLI